MIITVTAGLDMITEYQLEQAVADFEVQCAEGLAEKMDSVKGVEFDDTVLCDICRSVRDFLCLQCAVLGHLLNCNRFCGKKN